MADNLDLELVLEDPDPAAAVEEAAMGEPQYQRSFIYHPEGVHLITASNVMRDLNCPVIVRPTAWNKVKKFHGHFTAAAILESRAFCIDSIVVIHNNADEHNWSRAPGVDKVGKRVIWCIRVSVIGGCTAFHYGFGENFLWQIPSSICDIILSQLQGLGSSAWVAQLLSPEWAPTGDNFEIAEWPDLTPVKHMPDYYDLVFASSVRPCVGAIAKRGENAPLACPLLREEPKPLKYKRGDAKSNKGDWEQLPLDLSRQILGLAAVESAMSAEAGHWNAFLGMRRVCKEWKAEADSAAVARVKEALKLVKRAMKTGTLSDIIAARESVLGANLSTIPFICDAADLSIYNLMRLRRSMAPDELPPSCSSPSTKKRRAAKKQETKRVRFVSTPGTVS